MQIYLWLYNLDRQTAMHETTGLYTPQALLNHPLICLTTISMQFSHSQKCVAIQSIIFICKSPQTNFSIERVTIVIVLLG